MDELKKGCGCGHNHEHDHECGCGHDHDHECGCGHDHEMQTMKLVLENDEQLECSVLGVFEVGDKDYIALLPMGDDEVLLYQYIENEDGEGFELANIETDEEFEAVEDAFFDIFDSEAFEDFDDEEFDDEDFDDEDEEE